MLNFSFFLVLFWLTPIFSTLHAEGVRRDTKIFTPAGMIEAKDLTSGFKVCCINKEGKLTTSPITKIKTDMVMSLFEVTITGTSLQGEEKTVTILADALQRTYCPNRRAWVKFCELDPKKDFVCINFGTPTPIVAIREIALYVWKMKAPVYFFEVKEFGHFFASELFVPLHNTTFLVVPPLVVAASVAKDIALSLGLSFVKASAMEAFSNARKQDSQSPHTPDNNNSGNNPDPKGPKKDNDKAVDTAAASKKTDNSTSKPNQSSQTHQETKDPRLDKDPSTPVGRKSQSPESKVKKGTNAPAIINEKQYSGHAIDQMQERGIPPSAVENTLKNGTQDPLIEPGKIHYHEAKNNITVITDKTTEQIITVGYGKF